MVEQPAVNRRVAGSSPASGANFSAKHFKCFTFQYIHKLQNPGQTQGKSYKPLSCMDNKEFDNIF